MSWTQKPPLGTSIDFGQSQMRDLVGWWLFQEGAGDKVADLSGNGIVGTLSGFSFPAISTSGWNPGKFGRTLAFDGTNDYIEAEDDNFPSGAAPRTVTFWVKRPSSGNFAGAGGLYLFFYGTRADKNGFGMYGVVGTTDLYFYSHSYDIDITINLDDAEWHHLALTFDGTNLRAYKDAVLISTNNRSLLNTVLDTFVIGTSKTADQYFDGLFDDFRVYNRKLTAREIVDIKMDPFAMFMETQKKLWKYAAN